MTSRNLGKDIAIYGAVDLLFRVIGFAVFPVYAHIFSVAEFGIFALATATVGIAGVVANLGLSSATQRFYWDAPNDGATQASIVSTGLVVLATWSCLVVATLVATTYPARDLVESRYGISWTVAWVALATIVPEQILQYCLSVLRLHFAPWHFALVSCLKNLLGVTAGLVLVLRFDWRLEGLFVGGLAGALAAVPLALFLIRGDLSRRLQVTTARTLASFGYPFVFAGLAYWLFGAVDKWMLADLAGATELGLYAIAYKFAAVMVFLNSAFGQAWSPVAMKLRQDDRHYRNVYAQIFSGWFFLLVMAGSALALFGDEVLRLLTPSQYWAAAPVLAVLAMGIALSGTTQVTAVGISLERRTRLFAVAAWITALVNIIFNLVLIPRLGALGAAVATFLSYGLLTSMYLFWSQRLHPIPLELPKLLYSTGLAIGVPLAAATLALPEPSTLIIIGKTALILLMAAGGVALGIVDVAGIRKLLGERAQV